MYLSLEALQLTRQVRVALRTIAWALVKWERAIFVTHRRKGIDVSFGGHQEYCDHFGTFRHFHYGSASEIRAIQMDRVVP